MAWRARWARWWCGLGVHLPRPNVRALARTLHEAAQPRRRVRLVGELADHLPNRETVAGEAPGWPNAARWTRMDKATLDYHHRAPQQRPLGIRATRALLADPGVDPRTRAGL
jgi:hypothetical protein